MKFLGIDYGSKRVGLAVSDDAGKIAFPKAVIKNSPKLAEKVAEICSAEQISAIVLGESKNYAGEDNPAMKGIIRLKADLEKRGLAVDLEPEFMTSAQAERIQGKTENLDASAAAIILQSYLDKTR